MSDSFIKNNKINLTPEEKLKAEKNSVEVSGSTIFSQKVDLTLWEKASKKTTNLDKTRKPSLQNNLDNLEAQIQLFEQETQKFKDILAKPKGKNIDFSC